MDQPIQLCSGATFVGVCENWYAKYSPAFGYVAVEGLTERITVPADALVNATRLSVGDRVEFSVLPAPPLPPGRRGHVRVVAWREGRLLASQVRVLSDANAAA